MLTAHLEECLLSDGPFIVVGDLQNGYDMLPYLTGRTDFGKLFIGDYLDSYKAGPRQQVDALMQVCGLTRRSEARALIGNPEIDYLAGLDGLRTGAHNPTTYILLMDKRREIEGCLKPFFYHKASRTLFSHAGLTKQLWDAFELSFETLPETLHDWSLDYSSPFYYVGQGRGGEEPVGGPL